MKQVTTKELREFLMIYGSGLRISEATNLRVEDIDSENIRLFVRNADGTDDLTKVVLYGR